MIMMNRISFVLPCYNVARYINDCLDSLYAQNLSEDEFEVICVNDCSTDDTRNLIVAYQKSHPNLRLIDHTVNLTAGGARNTGIEAASGSYIWFVDPDDMIQLGSSHSIMKTLETKPVDILLFNNEIVDENKKHIENQVVFADTETCSGQEYIVKYFPMQMSKVCIVWRCVFRRDFLVSKQIRYPQMRKSQDVVFMWHSILAADAVASTESVYYKYRKNPYSVDNMSLKANVAFSERILWGFQISKLLDNDSCTLQPIIRDDMEKALNWCVNGNKPLLVKLDEVELSKYYGEMRNHKEELKKMRKKMNRANKWLYCGNFTEWIWKTKIKMLK